MIFLSFLQTLIIGSVIFYEYKKGSIAIFLWAINFIVIGFGSILAISIEKKYSDIVYIKAFIFGIAFISIYLLTRILLDKKPLKRIDLIKQIRIKLKENKLEEKDNKIFEITSIIALILFLIYVIRMFGNIFEATWSDFTYAKVSFFSLNGITIFFSDILRKVSFIVLYIYILKKKYFKFLLYFIILLFPVLITRNRVEMLPLFIVIILYSYIKYEKITFKLLLKYIFLGIIIVIFLYVLRIYRFYGSFYNFVEKFNCREFIESVFKLFETNNGELGLIDAFYYFIEKKNNFPGFGKLATYNRMLLVLLPTKLSFGLKSSDFAITMYSAYFNEYSNVVGSMHPTLFGDCYANFGYLGVFLGIFWAILAKIIDKICNRKNVFYSIVLCIIWGYSYVIMGRGAIYNGFATGIHLTIFLGLVFLFKKMKNSIFRKKNEK